jgi:flagellar biogenesis protein FliO
MTRNDTDNLDRVPKTLGTMIGAFLLVVAIVALLIWLL